MNRQKEGRRRRSARGAVTAELAMALPMLALVTLALVWLVSLGLAQVRLVDAARETARAVARGETHAQAAELGHRVAPSGARIEITPGELIQVRVSARIEGPGGLFSFVPAARLEAEAVAAAEPGT